MGSKGEAGNDPRHDVERERRKNNETCDGGSDDEGAWLSEVVGGASEDGRVVYNRLMIISFYIKHTSQYL